MHDHFVPINDAGWMRRSEGGGGRETATKNINPVHESFVQRENNSLTATTTTTTTKALRRDTLPCYLAPQRQNPRVHISSTQIIKQEHKPCARSAQHVYRKITNTLNPHNVYTRTQKQSAAGLKISHVFSPLLVHFSPEQNIFPKGPGLNPRLLRRVGQSPIHRHVRFTLMCVDRPYTILW